MSEPGRGKSAGYGNTRIEATQKSLEILQYLKEHGPATLTEVASDLGWAKSTVYRHLHTLENAGHIAEYEDGYHIGQLYLDYGIHAQRNHPLYHAAKPKVDALADQIGEKVWCAVEENGLVAHIYLKSGNELYRSFTRVGFRGHLHAFSSGKAILAYMPPDHVEEIIATHGLPAYTENTITDEEELFAELETVRERGVAVHMEEAVSGSNAISVPVLHDDELPVGSVCVAGPAHRLDKSTLYGDLSELLLEFKNEIELSLKYESPPAGSRSERPKLVDERYS